jgi:drug/metabolite transporter (DMT)-like permease
MAGVSIDDRSFNKLEKRLLVRVNTETLGAIYGLIGVICFSLTFPAMRVAVRDLDPTIVGLGRAIVASVLAAVFLFVGRESFPSRQQVKSLFITAAGVVVGFPVLSAWAMRRVPAAHGAVTLGLLPLATAIGGKLRAGETPSRKFWIAGAAGSATVVAFALVTGGGRIQPADLALLGSIVATAIGYAEGGRLARELGGPQVICWTLLVSAPFLVVPVAFLIMRHGLAASPISWLGFAYVSVFSMFFGFFAWYRGLALGGIARVGQIQLLQPFLTIFASALLLSEQVTLVTAGFALAVLAFVAIGRQASVKRS